MTLRQTEKSRVEVRGEFLDPKKHYVRLNGWLPAFARYSGPRKRKVQYLTLCAKQAIDVRYFAQKGVLYRNREGNEYPSLTFIEANDEDYAAITESLGKVRLGIHGRLEEVLLNADDVSHQDLVQSFPYDVVNLDFCGDILPRKDHPYSKTLRCISKIIKLQAEKETPQWHMFLTFRAHPGQGNDEAHTQLCDIVQGNLARAEFRAAYGERAQPDVLLNADYPEFLRVGVCKLLARLARDEGYSLTIDGTFTYSRRDDAYSIVKIVAGFTRIRTGMPNTPREDAAYGACVTGLFGSNAVAVDEVIEGEHARIDADLRPVLAELDAANVVP